MTLSEFIRQYRLAHGLSQRQLAIACNLSNGYISMLEKNLNPKTGLPLTPTLPVLKKLAGGMGMKLGDLLTAADDIPIIGLNPSDGTESMNDIDFQIMELLALLPPDVKQRVLGYIQGIAYCTYSERIARIDVISMQTGGGMLSTIGERIHEKRVAAGMSADELAERIGKNRATIYRYENGEVDIPISVIEKLAVELNVSITYLLGLQESN